MEEHLIANALNDTDTDNILRSYSKSLACPLIKFFKSDVILIKKYHCDNGNIPSGAIFEDGNLKKYLFDLYYFDKAEFNRDRIVNIGIKYTASFKKDKEILISDIYNKDNDLYVHGKETLERLRLFFLLRLYDVKIVNLIRLFNGLELNEDNRKGISLIILYLEHETKISRERKSYGILFDNYINGLINYDDDNSPLNCISSITNQTNKDYKVMLDIYYENKLISKNVYEIGLEFEI